MLHHRGIAEQSLEQRQIAIAPGHDHSGLVLDTAVAFVRHLGQASPSAHYDHVRGEPQSQSA
jgi:hypothetical protein